MTKESGIWKAEEVVKDVVLWIGGYRIASVFAMLALRQTMRK